MLQRPQAAGLAPEKGNNGASVRVLPSILAADFSRLADEVRE
jgi:hypothetical protein